MKQTDAERDRAWIASAIDRRGIREVVADVIFALIHLVDDAGLPPHEDAEIRERDRLLTGLENLL